MTVANLRSARFRTLLIARGGSTLCTGTNVVVMAWLILAVGGSTWDLAAMTAINATAGMLASAACGPLVDRADAKLVAAGTEVARAVPVAALPVLHALGMLELWHLLLAAAVVGALHAVSVVAYGAVLPEVLPAAELGAANGLWQAVTQVGIFLGAGLGGLLIPVLGDAGSLWVEVAGRLATAGSLLTVRTDRRGQVPGTTNRPRFLTDVGETWQVIRRDRPLLWITLFAAIPGSLIWGANVVLPPLARRVLDAGPTGYGLIDAAWGAGAFMAGLLFVRLPGSHRDVRHHIGALLLVGVLFLGLGVAPNLLVAVVLSAAVGGAALGSLVLHQAYVQARAPAAHLGRILAVSQCALSALWLACALGAGGLSLIVPLRLVMVGWGGLVVVAGALLGLLLRGTPSSLSPARPEPVVSRGGVP